MVLDYHLQTMTVNEIDARIRENGLNKHISVTNDEYRLINAYRIADETLKDKIRTLLNVQ